MNKIVLVVVFACFQQFVCAQGGHENLWKQFRLPESYSGVADFVPDAEERSVWKSVRFTVTFDSLSMIHALQLPGAGESIMEIRYGSHKESLLIQPSQQQVQRNLRFAHSLTDAGEIDVTPMPIIRTLRLQSRTIETKEVKRSDDGTVTLRILDSSNQTKFEAEIDYRDDKILEYRVGKRGHRPVALVRYAGWVELPSGSHIPTEIVSELWNPSLEFEYRVEILLRECIENTGGAHAQRPLIPSGFTVIDSIDGVTKLNGKVIAQIEQAGSETEGTGTFSPNGQQASNWLVWIGVGLVIVAGIMLGRKTKAAGS